MKGNAEQIRLQLSALTDEQLKARLTDEILRNWDLQRETHGRSDNYRVIGLVQEECERRNHPEWFGIAQSDARKVLADRKAANDRARNEILSKQPRPQP